MSLPIVKFILKSFYFANNSKTKQSKRSWIKDFFNNLNKDCVFFGALQICRFFDSQYALNRIKIISLETFKWDSKVKVVLIAASLAVMLSKIVSFTNMNVQKMKKIYVLSSVLHVVLNLGYYFLFDNLVFFSFYFLFMRIFQFVDFLVSLLMFKYLFGQKHILYYFVYNDISVLIISVFGFFLSHIYEQNFGRNFIFVNLFFNSLNIIIFFVY